MRKRLCFDENEITLQFFIRFFERSLQIISLKNTQTFQSWPLYPMVLSIFVCSLLRLSQICLNDKNRNECEKNLSVVYANERVS